MDRHMPGPVSYTHLDVYKRQVLLVSHDRYFLDKICTRIFEIENRTLENYPGNYTFYVEEKRRRREAQEKEYLLKSREIARLEGIRCV